MFRLSRDSDYKVCPIDLCWFDYVSTSTTTTAEFLDSYFSSVVSLVTFSGVGGIFFVSSEISIAVCRVVYALGAPTRVVDAKRIWEPLKPLMCHWYTLQSFIWIRASLCGNVGQQNEE